MSDPACCILAICCPGGSEAQRKSLAEAMSVNGDLALARRHADWILDNFDLAPKDSLISLKGSIAQIVRGSNRP